MTTPDRRDAPAGLPTVASAGRALSAVPAQLAEIAEAAGVEAALTIARQYAGTEIRIPLRSGPECWLTLAVGAEAAEKICAAFRVHNANGREVGGVRIYVPMLNASLMARAKAQLYEDLRSGQFTPLQAARRAGLTERTAYKILAQLKDDRQGQLF